MLARVLARALWPLCLSCHKWQLNVRAHLYVILGFGKNRVGNPFVQWAVFMHVRFYCRCKPIVLNIHRWWEKNNPRTYNHHTDNKHCPLQKLFHNFVTTAYRCKCCNVFVQFISNARPILVIRCSKFSASQLSPRPHHQRLPYMLGS